MSTTPSVHHIDGAPVIVGAGIAGLVTALALAPLPAVVLAKAPLEVDAASAWAQGGLAAAIGEDDAPALHLADTLAAGGGIVDADVARLVTSEAPAAIESLRALGVCFDCDAAGRPRLSLEAAHSRRRIVNASGDGTGHEIMRALAAAVRATPSVRVLEGAAARRIITTEGAVAGVLALAHGEPVLLPTARVVIATGGIGGLYQHTTNPRGAIGAGLAMAARAGAALADVEFVQFHPTALDSGREPLALVSEAVRGEGAVLIDETGHRFMAGISGAELAPRDVVARAVWAHVGAGHRVFLDTRASIGPHFAQRFPTIAAACAAAGIDPAGQPIPIRPAAHYHMGGIAVDAQGRSSLPGLWACGEAVSTGLHGANRLASNSLIEGVVFGKRVAASVASVPAGRVRALENLPAVPPSPDPTAVRPILTRCAGLVRNATELAAGIARLRPLVLQDGPAADPAIVALLIASAALARCESRGGHFRADAPASDPAQARRTFVRLDGVLDASEAIVEHEPARASC